jgi:hypothetical protein
MRFLRRRMLRSGLETSVVSAQPLESVSTSANNWGGASQTIIELSKELDRELGELNIDGTYVPFPFLISTRV